MWTVHPHHGDGTAGVEQPLLPALRTAPFHRQGEEHESHAGTRQGGGSPAESGEDEQVQRQILT